MKNDVAFSFILFNEGIFSINSINAKINMNKIIVLVSMVCLISIVILMLVLFLNNKINNDKYSLGVMKAHGFKSIKLALAYTVYPTVILIPCATIGYLSSLILSPIFEKSFNYGFSLPLIDYNFNPLILGVFIGAPLIVLVYATIICVCIKLRSKPLELLNDLDDAKVSRFTGIIKKFKKSKKFLSTLKWNFAISKKKLILLCVFGAYCIGLQMILSINLYTMPKKWLRMSLKEEITIMT